MLAGLTPGLGGAQLLTLELQPHEFDMVNVYLSEMFKTLCTLCVLKQRSVFHKDLNIDKNMNGSI